MEKKMIVRRWSGVGPYALYSEKGPASFTDQEKLLVRLTWANAAETGELVDSETVGLPRDITRYLVPSCGLAEWAGFTYAHPDYRYSGTPL